MQKKKIKDTATVSAPSRMTRREVVCVSREGVERVNLSSRGVGTTYRSNANLPVRRVC